MVSSSGAGHRRIVLGAGVLLGLAATGLWLGDRALRASSTDGDAGTMPRRRSSLPDPTAEGPAIASATEPLAARQASPPPDLPRAHVPPPDETHLNARLRALGSDQTALAIELAREGNRRFPDGPGAPERASILIHALASEGRSAEARAEAEEMVNRYPDSDWVREVERFTGAHRHRNIRVNEGGGLETY